ncbi:lysine-2,3-aminomutase-like protein [Segnochrobactrum spirostomi]|uniref:Lysine-2,3-aminomutase-like protein n=1 Tax=Segnochrobactrum spirostomi TaxID=2608987 RepID=A0A6A7Y9T4_9HYPH|nr:lysine-2,3-aminomutase-like protein [Segnochrobactrum spirostomi]MQT14219.1 lysine-2,3-aminomutase-like protein [Segnochrobactrum spirostomi]
MQSFSPSAPRTLHRPKDLVDAGLVPTERLAALERVAERYAVSVTPAMADLIEAADPCDPIGLQFLPTDAELHVLEAERADPIGDAAHSPVEGIVHRYPDRVLLKLVHVCPVYCRFCFRREMVGPGEDAFLSPEALEAALCYIRSDANIWEVVVTGGDPLVVSPRRLAALMAALAAVPHVRIVRFHTRVPVVAPERVDAALAAALRVDGLATYVVLHANHARELTDAARAACARLVDAGIPMLSQSVLLRGINDDADSLGALMRAFVESRVKPYYLHHGDLAPGTSHFRVPIREGQAILKALRGRWSGLCQPSYVLDIPGGHGKVPIGPTYLSGDDETSLEIEDPNGVVHIYPPKPDSA